MRRLRLLIACFVLPLVASGCSLFGATELGIPGYTRTFSPFVRQEIADQWLKENGCKQPQVYDPYTGGTTPAYCQSEMDAALAVSDPGGHLDGSTTKTRLAQRKGTNLLAAFGHSAVVGNVRGGFVSKTSNFLNAHGLLVMRSGKSKLCLSFSGVGKQPFTAQDVQGTFTVNGGTGKGAKIHASGAFLSIEPNGVKDATKPFPIYIWLLPKKLTLGSPRGFPTACQAATKPPPPPPPPANASATFNGFAFAPANTKTLPAGTTLYPDRSTISGAVGCGNDNNLYAVINYTGPNTTTDAALFGPPGTIALNLPVSQGENDLLLLATPPNGSYTLKLAFKAANSPAFIPMLTLARTC